MTAKSFYRALLNASAAVFGASRTKRWDACLRFRRVINLKQPRTLADKLCWLELNTHDPMKTTCTDKLAVRDYVMSKGLGDILIPLCCTPISDAQKIVLRDLPDRFVMQAAHGSGMNFICRDRAKVTEAELCALAADWLRHDYPRACIEPHYRGIPRRVLISQYLGENITDYKFHCFHGEPDFVLACGNRETGVQKRLYTMDWQPIDAVVGPERGEKEFPRPACLSEMIAICRKLAADFDFVRVDLYEVAGKVWFGELTFSPGAGVLPNFSLPFLREKGKLLHLPTRVLQVIGFLGRGGDTEMVRSVMDAMDEKRYHFDFLTHEGSTNLELVQQLKKQGCRVYMLPGDVRRMGLAAYIRTVYRILKHAEEKYSAVHVHTGMQSGAALLAARLAGVPTRICHSHVTSVLRPASRMQRIFGIPVLRLLIRAGATKRIACSRRAGEFLFRGKPYSLMYNAVDPTPWLSISESDTAALRRELGADEKTLLIGFAGRMNPVKNPDFVLKLAQRMAERKDLRFVLAGDGPKLAEIREAAKVCSNVTVTGWRSDIPALMTAFDCLLLPSESEGFPVTLLEAQAAGCPCLASDRVTEEAEIGMQLVKFLPLEDMDGWVQALNDLQHIPCEIRHAAARKLSSLGFDWNSFAERWLGFYDSP